MSPQLATEQWSPSQNIQVWSHCFFQPKVQAPWSKAESISSISVAGSPIKLQSSIENLDVVRRKHCVDVMCDVMMSWCDINLSKTECETTDHYNFTKIYWWWWGETFWTMADENKIMQHCVGIFMTSPWHDMEGRITTSVTFCISDSILVLILPYSFQRTRK